jgi:hypothetical protein
MRLGVGLPTCKIPLELGEVLVTSSTPSNSELLLVTFAMLAKPSVSGSRAQSKSIGTATRKAWTQLTFCRYIEWFANRFKKTDILYAYRLSLYIMNACSQDSRLKDYVSVGL